MLQVFDDIGTLDGTFTLPRSDAQAYVQNDFTLAANPDGMQLTTHGVSIVAAPVVTAGTTAIFTAPGLAVVADSTLSLTDPGSSITIVGATVVVTSNFFAGDTLAFADQYGITGNFDATHDVLTLSGSVASVAASSTVSEIFTPPTLTVGDTITCQRFSGGT